MRFATAAFCSFVFVATFAIAASAQTTISEIASVQILNTTTPLANQVYLASYYCNGTPCVPDGQGGEGLLIRNGTGCTSSTTDAGSTFYDATTGCWYRQNLNGDLRQWGITNGSAYDASIFSTATTPTAVSPANPKIASAFTALAKIGITQVETHEVSIYINAPLGASLIVPVSSSLTCGATGGGEYTGGVYAGRNTNPSLPLNTKPGTIFLELYVVRPIWTVERRG